MQLVYLIGEITGQGAFPVGGGISGEINGFTVRSLGPVMFKDVKATSVILGLIIHGPSIWTRDIHIH